MTKYEISKRILALLELDSEEIIDAIYQLASDIEAEDD